MQHETRTLTQAVRRALYGAGIGAAALGLAACGGGGGSGNGSLSVGVTDAPVDRAEHVYVQFSSITLNPGGGDDDDDEANGSDASGSDGSGDGDNGDGGSDFVTIEFDEPKRIDLLAQQNGDSKLLIENESVPAGDYDWIRLGVDLGQGETQIVIGDTPYDLDIPSGAQTGLKLVSGFSVADGGSLDLTIDFDLRKSIVETGNSGDDKYKLKPALRLVQTDDTGEIDVTASETYVSNNQCGTDPAKNAVYVFEGDVTPDDVDGKEPDPVTTVLDSDKEEAGFTGTAAFLEPGTYTVTYVCNAEGDDPEVNQGDLDFRDVESVEVNVGETSNYDLP